MQLRRLLLLALFAAFVARVAATYHVFNETMDEPAHIRAGLEFLRTGQYTFEPQHPPLARITLAALPECFARFGLYRHLRLWRAVFGIHDEPANYWVGLAVSRAGNLLFGALILLFVWWWSWLLFGPWPAVAACVVAACSPNLIAHCALATLDAAAAAGTLIVAFFFWRWSEHPGWRYALAAGAAFGFAVLCKFSTLAFLPPLAVVYFVTARWNKWTSFGAAQARTGLLRGAAFALATGVIIWAGYRFDAGPLVPPGHHYSSPYSTGFHSSAAAVRLTHLLGHRTLPAPKFWQGLIDLAGHNEQGHNAYLLGRWSAHGWWYYFLVAVALKTTLPLLLLVALSFGLYVVHRGSGPARGMIYPIWAVVVVMAVSMAGHLNIGIRHLLPIYPFFAILAAGVFSEALRPRRWSRGLLAAALALLGWHAAESIVAHPDYLAYFNEIARGREERYLADSNLDWGQDLARLGRYMGEHSIASMQLSYFGLTNPDMLGVRHQPLAWRPGWTAISVQHMLAMRGDPVHGRWLRERRPDMKIGKSIWLYDVSPVEAAAWPKP